MTGNTNPYESPSEPLGKSRPTACKGPSVRRGFLCSLPWAFVGVSIPGVIFFATLVIQWLWSGRQGESPASLLLRDAPDLLAPSIGVGVLFALAAFRNHAPRVQIGMTGSLMVVGGILISGILFLGLLTLIFGLENNSYAPDPWEPLKILLVLLFPCSYIYFAIRTDFQSTGGGKHAG